MLRPTRSLLLASAVLTLTSCKSSKEDSPGSDTEIKTQAPEPKAAPPRVLDRDFVPTKALEELEGLSLSSRPPCSLTLDTLKPTLESISRFRGQLAEAQDEATAVQILTELSADLSARLPAIAARSETDELRRISAELTASIGDLAESLKLASDALTARDKQAAAATMRRIHNGVANARSSIEGLIDQCAL